MTSTLKDLPTTTERGVKPPSVRHIYPPMDRRPTIGDRAFCGWIKQTPTRWASNAEARASGVPLCVVCADLDGRGVSVRRPWWRRWGRSS